MNMHCDERKNETKQNLTECGEKEFGAKIEEKYGSSSSCRVQVQYPYLVVLASFASTVSGPRSDIKESNRESPQGVTATHGATLKGVTLRPPAIRNVLWYCTR